MCIVREPLMHDGNLTNGEVKRVYEMHHSDSYTSSSGRFWRFHICLRSEYGVQYLDTVVAVPFYTEMSHYIAAQ